MSFMPEKIPDGTYTSGKQLFDDFAKTDGEFAPKDLVTGNVFKLSAAEQEKFLPLFKAWLTEKHPGFRGWWHQVIDELEQSTKKRK